MRAIADSGYIIALVNRRDPDHERVTATARSLRAAPWLPTPALTEICYVLRSRLGPLAVPRFLERLHEPSVRIDLLDPRPEDYERCAQLLVKYGDGGLDFVDALVVATAERLEVGTLLTLDRRHFLTVRPAHRSEFQLLPEVV